jgi:hypothetical protein
VLRAPRPVIPQSLTRVRSRQVGALQPPPQLSNTLCLMSNWYQILLSQSSGFAKRPHLSAACLEGVDQVDLKLFEIPLVPGRAGTCSFELHWTPSPETTALGNKVFKAWAWSKQPGLQARAGCFPQPMPFLDRDQDRGLNAATRDDLRTLFDRRLQELAEASFCVLYLPGSQGTPPRRHLITGQMTSQLRPDA